MVIQTYESAAFLLNSGFLSKYGVDEKAIALQSYSKQLCQELEEYHSECHTSNVIHLCKAPFT